MRHYPSRDLPFHSVLGHLRLWSSSLRTSSSFLMGNSWAPPQASCATMCGSSSCVVVLFHPLPPLLCSCHCDAPSAPPRRTIFETVESASSVTSLEHAEGVLLFHFLWVPLEFWAVVARARLSIVARSCMSILTARVTKSSDSRLSH